MNVLKVNLTITALFLTAVSFLASCDSKNEEGIYAQQSIEERAVPVRITEVFPQEFSRELNYNATLEGAFQSEARSNVDGVLKKLHVQVGQYVKKDSLIASFDEDLPASGFIQAKSSFEIAGSTYKRMKNLYEAGGVSRHQLDEAETQYNISRANYDSALKNVNILAPISGTVSNIGFRSGDNVNKGMPVATIADLSKLNARIYVNEKDISGFYKGLEVEVVSGRKNFTAKGSVQRVAMAANPQRRAFEVEIVMDNAESKFRPGMIVDINAYINRKEEAIVIPRLIIQMDSEGEYVYIVKGKRAQKSYLVTGMESGGLIHVEKGLAPGDMLVTEGQFSLEEDLQVAVID